MTVMKQMPLTTKPKFENWLIELTDDDLRRAKKILGYNPDQVIPAPRLLFEMAHALSDIDGGEESSEYDLFRKASGAPDDETPEQFIPRLFDRAEMQRDAGTLKPRKK